jgi:signal transduction histidine kinase
MQMSRITTAAMTSNQCGLGSAQSIEQACKFTKEGEMKVRATSVRNGRGWIELSVSNTVIAMTAEQQATAVRGVQSAERTTAQHSGGMGLGPRHHRKLARMMGGGVMWRARRKGPVFTMHLPPITDA